MAIFNQSQLHLCGDKFIKNDIKLGGEVLCVHAKIWKR